jgi:drug/metabolite transporter (DMT)-like permease
MICFFGGVQYITVSQMSAGLYTYPLFVTILAGPLLGEKVGIWRFSALAIGMAGALLLINPFSTSFHPMQILPVIAGFFYALNILILRRYCRRERPLAIAFMVGLMFFVVGIIGAVIISFMPLSESMRMSLPFLLIGWPDFSMLVLGLCMLASLLNLFGNICLSRAYQIADSSWLAPLDFSYLIFAMIWGRILFGYWPDGQALIGMVLIAGAGVLIVVRENMKKQAAKAV